MAELPRLSLAEWIVLALIDEAPRHGFAVAALTGDRGEIGEAWHVPRPIVYRSLDRLGSLELVRVTGTELGDRGPQRSVLATTSAGVSATGEWLGRPVDHVRDVRSELLVKLLLRSRRALPTDGLIAAQRAVFAPMQLALEGRRGGGSDSGRMLALWRAESMGAAMRFLDVVATADGGPVTQGPD